MIDYQVDHVHGIIRETFTGEITADQLREYWERLFSDPEANKITKTLVSMTQATPALELPELRAIMKETHQHKRQNLAIVMTAELKPFMDLYFFFSLKEEDIEFFENEVEAFKWLTKINP